MKFRPRYLGALAMLLMSVLYLFTVQNVQALPTAIGGVTIPVRPVQNVSTGYLKTPTLTNQNSDIIKLNATKENERVLAIRQKFAEIMAIKQIVLILAKVMQIVLPLYGVAIVVATINYPPKTKTKAAWDIAKALLFIGVGLIAPALVSIMTRSACGHI